MTVQKISTERGALREVNIADFLAKIEGDHFDSVVMITFNECYEKAQLSSATKANIKTMKNTYPNHGSQLSKINIRASSSKPATTSANPEKAPLTSILSIEFTAFLALIIPNQLTFQIRIARQRLFKNRQRLAI